MSTTPLTRDEPERVIAAALDDGSGAPVLDLGAARAVIDALHDNGYEIRRRGAPRIKPTHLIDSRGRWSRCGLADVQKPHSSGPFTDDPERVTCRSCRKFVGLDPRGSDPVTEG